MSYESVEAQNSRPRLSGRSMRSVLLVLSLAVAAALSGCAPSAPPESVEQPFADFELSDQLGRDFRSGDLLGRVWVASFMATGCEQPCATTTAAMLRLQNELFNHPRAEGFRLVSFSVDPVSDTQDALERYSREQAYAYQERWRFATLGGEVLAAVSASLGFEPFRGRLQRPPLRGPNRDQPALPQSRRRSL